MYFAAIGLYEPLFPFRPEHITLYNLLQTARRATRLGLFTDNEFAMWALSNRTAYAAERNWTRDKSGAHWWIVAVRATFDLGFDGRLRLADDQLPPNLAPEYFGEAGLSSLRYDSDLLAIKPSSEVLLHAHAHAPAGRPTSIVPVSLRMGKLEKHLVVHGDRNYRSDGRTTSAPAPFVVRPIRYELAFGGADLSDPDPREHRIDERNPIGRGFARRPERLGNAPAHIVEYADGVPASAGPAGFGPIDATWLPRRTFAGTYDDRWEQTKKPFLPDDYDAKYALSSPEDQRLAQPLLGGERIELLNMTRNGRLVFEVPRMTIELSSAFGRRKEAHDPPRLVTLVVEPEEGRLTLVWQSALRVPAPNVDYLDQTEIVERSGA